MVKRTQVTGRAEYAQAIRERVPAEREAAAALAELTAARDRLAAQATPQPQVRAAAVKRDTARQEIAKLERRLALAQRTLEAIDKRVADSRARALGDQSGFEHLSAAHPLLFLPVRLETRFALYDGKKYSFEENSKLEQVLLVRIYPDEIHEDSHEPELTQAERRWAGEFRRKVQQAADQKPIRDAWAELIGRAGATRAAWIGQVALGALKPGLRPAIFSRPSLARLLPDRWVAYATLADGSTLTSQSSPVREPLETGPSPQGMDWMVSFDAAVKAGMALIVRGIPAEVTEIRRLIVVGARGTLDPQQAQSELEKLLEAHRYTRGLGFVAPGTATNSSPDTRAGYSTRPPVPEIIDIEQRRFLVGGRTAPLCQRGDQTDGTALAAALGIEPSVFAFSARADSTDQLDARNLAAILVAATQRTLARLLTGILDENAVAEVLSFAVERVSALGPLPTLRVGSQPYPVLPITPAADMRLPPGSIQERCLPVLNRMRSIWQSAASGLDWVGKDGADPGATLVRILQRDGVAARIAFRPFLGPQLGAAAANGLGGTSAVTLTRQRKQAADALTVLGVPRALNTPLLQTMVLSMGPTLTDPIVQPDDAPAQSAQRAAEYLEIAASLRSDRLLQHDYPGGERPRSLFFAIARLAMLELADARAREVLQAAGANPAQWDDEQVPSAYRDPLATLLARLQAPDPVDPLASVAFHLSVQGRDAGILHWMRETLRYFKTRAAESIELHLRATLGLFSNRLDAWYTALASDQLLALRAGVNTSMGINAGGYGVLESIRRAPRSPVAGTAGVFSIPTNGGYIHAPSVNHAAAAAVLRSVHLAHSATMRREAFSVDLSSQRVRRALPLLEGIRAGQPLAALLGYRIERELAGEQLQRFIAPFRAIAPLLANKLTPSAQPAESVAASNVVDGLRLLELAGYDGESSASAQLLQGPLGMQLAPDVATAINRVLASAQDAVDAVSDLVLAEGVYQAVQGNPTRVGAAADSTSGAPIPPVEPAVIRTPRSGIAATHRVLTLIDAINVTTIGWARTPRASAEPRLESWCAGMLPATTQIHLRARFRDADGTVVAVLEDVPLNEIFDEAVEADQTHLPFGALDLVTLADPRDTPQRSALEVRLSALLELRRPPAAENAALELDYERREDWDAATFGIVETLEIAAQLRNLIGHARPCVPDDFALPGGVSALRLEPADHASRAESAVRVLADATAQLTAASGTRDASALREALFVADALGVAGAAPTSLRDATDPRERARTENQARLVGQLLAQAKAVLAELARRTRKLADPTTTDSDARLKAVFGESFVTLPVMTDSLGGPVIVGTTPTGATGAAVRAWLSRSARVREGVRLLDVVIGAAEAVAQSQTAGIPPRLNARHLGGSAGERWIGLPPAAGTSLPGGRVSLLTIGAGSQPMKAATGLFIDEWLEVVPATEETTSVAFHYEAPSSLPPQLLLLGVPPPGLERWTPDAAQRLVSEALDLGRIRLVDMDDVQGLGQLLPAFVTAENTAGDVASLDVAALTRTGAK